jgi:hypothetical protein
MTGPDNAATTNLKSSSPSSYQVLSANSIHELERHVNTALKDGMRLYGYPFPFKDSICQAVTKN